MELIHCHLFLDLPKSFSDVIFTAVKNDFQYAENLLFLIDGE